MWATLLALTLKAAAAAGEGRPLFYWGARPPLIAAALPAGAATGEEARVLEVHAAQDARGLFLRLTFDRPVHEAVRLPDGTPVSGRLRALLYIDVDDDRRTGWGAGERDLRTGADQRLEVGVLSVGADPEERTEAQAVITLQLTALSPEGRLRTLWRGDDSATPERVSAHGDWLELRLPPELWTPRESARLVLSAGGEVRDGRIPPP